MAIYEDLTGKTNDTHKVFPGLPTLTSDFNEVKDACKFIGNTRNPIVNSYQHNRCVATFNNGGGLSLFGYRWIRDTDPDEWIDLFDLSDYAGATKDTFNLNTDKRLFNWYVKIAGWSQEDAPYGSNPKSINNHALTPTGNHFVIDINHITNLSNDSIYFLNSIIEGLTLIYRVKPSSNTILQMKYLNQYPSYVAPDSDFRTNYFFYRVIISPPMTLKVPT